MLFTMIIIIELSLVLTIII